MRVAADWCTALFTVVFGYAVSRLQSLCDPLARKGFGLMLFNTVLDSSADLVQQLKAFLLSNMSATDFDAGSGFRTYDFHQLYPQLDQTELQQSIPWWIRQLWSYKRMQLNCNAALNETCVLRLFLSKDIAATWHKNMDAVVAPYLLPANITATHRMYTQQYGIDHVKGNHRATGNRSLYCFVKSFLCALRW
jgi:hypothetical protein